MYLTLIITYVHFIKLFMYLLDPTKYYITFLVLQLLIIQP